MSETTKKNSFQFTIRFNKDIPMHVLVSDYLNAQGRNKAYVIAEAIMLYMKYKQESLACSYEDAMDKAFISQPVEVPETELTEKKSVTKRKKKSEQDHLVENKSVSMQADNLGKETEHDVSDDEEIARDETDQLDGFDDDDLLTIMESMQYLEGLSEE